jgi:hypothetical protein
MIFIKLILNKGQLMNKLSTLIIFSCFIFFASMTSFASEKILLTATNDEDSSLFKLIAKIDDETQSIVGFYKEEISKASKLSRELLPIQDLGKLGIVLVKHGNYNIITLKSDNIDLDHGGNVTIDTIFNGITNEHKKYELELSHLTDGWTFLNQNKNISKMYIEINRKVLIGAVGIKNIRME